MNKPTCSIEDCGNRAAARSWCKKHYGYWKRRGDPLAGPVTPDTCSECTVDGCEQRYEARGFCVDHYQRWKAHGDPLGGRIIFDDAARFRSKYIINDNGCHVWQAALTPKMGYGQFYADGRMWSAHLWAWRQIHGPVPEGLELDHFRYPKHGCVGPSCANPNHVRLVTHYENLMRGDGPASLNAAKTHCKRGHPFDEINTYITKAGRACRICSKAHMLAWREAHRNY